jgi:hypothetical protein
MQRITFTLVTIALFVCLFCSLEQQAHAYVDPGSSLLVFQSLGAILTGAAFHFRRRLKSLFVRNQNKETSEDRH